MSCILRSSKFARYIAGFARHVVINTPREFDYNLLSSNHCICQSIPRSLATHASAQHDSSLEYGLRKIDQGVRRTGRISRQDIEEILEELRNAHTATSSQSLLVIRCCGNLVPEELPEVRTKLVQEIWQTLQKLDIPIDVSHYNALLRVYLENEYAFSPTEFLSEMESKGIEPNRVTYQRLIARYCQVGDIEGATRILEFMQEKQLPVNENVFNALIMGHAQAGDMESAKGIISVMAQAGLEASEDTYTTLLCGYAKAGDIESIQNVLEECQSKEMQLLDKDVLEIVYNLAINGHKDHVPFVLGKVRKQVGYIQDAINIILRLINKNQDDVALQVLKTMSRITRSDGTLQSAGNFLIKQLVKIGRPPEKIIEICKWLKDEGLNENAINLATESALQMANEKLAYPLLKEMKDNNLEIRPHFFWPLLVSKANDPTGEGIVSVLSEMSKFNVTANNETIRDYVIPNLKCKSSEIITILKQADISVGSSASNLVHSLLLRNDIEEAAIIASRIDAYYHPNIIKRPLTNALCNTNDVKSYVTLLRHIYENLDRREAVINEEDLSGKSSLDKNEIIGSFILDLTSTRSKFPLIVEEVLKGLIEQGLSVSNVTAEKIQDSLGEKMSENISKMLDRLTSGELVPAPIVRKPPTYVPSSKMNISQLEKLIQNLTAKNQECSGLKRQLLTLYCRAKDLENTEALLQEIETENFQHTSGTYAQVVDLYCYHDNLEKALEYYEKFKESSGEIMDNTKTLRLANLYIKSDRFDQAIELLSCPKKDQTSENSYGYNTLCWRMLNHLAGQGKIKELQILFDTLHSNNYMEISNMVLGPLIKVYLVNNDLDAALSKFEECCSKFRTTPWKNELACRLIQTEDAERLQKLTDLSTSVHGEINSLYDLVFAFVECGRIRQARKILETPGLQNRTHKISTACQRYREEGSSNHLEGLKDATKDLNHIDRSEIYYQLLLTYIKQNDVEKTQSLWIQMQEEDITPTEQFLFKLGSFLKQNNIAVPFKIPEDPVAKELQNETTPPVPIKVDKRISPQNSYFLTSIKNGEVDKALEIYKQKPQSFTNSDISSLIEILVQKERLEEATKLTLKLLENNSKPVFRIFRFLLNKLSHNGNIETLKLIGEKLNSDLKKILSFDNRLCHAYLVSGKSEEYLNSLEKELEQANEQDLKEITEKFPRGGAVGILEKCPELLDKFEQLAIKYAQRDIIAPMNVLWSYYFKEHNDSKAEEIWNKYLQNCPRLMFQRVVQHCRDNKDEQVAAKLINHLKSTKVTDGALGNAYSCFLDILVANEKNDEVVSTFESSLQNVKIDSLNRTAVLRVKEVYLKLGKSFDYPIPAKKSKTTTSNNEDSTIDEMEAKAN